MMGIPDDNSIQGEVEYDYIAEYNEFVQRHGYFNYWGDW